MRVLVQRSLESSVTIDGICVGKISHGIVALVGFTQGDTIEDIQYCVNKLIRLRIFDDENGKMNQSILEHKGSVLSISQFTLYANTNKGNRPSYIDALASEEASKLYEIWNEELSKFVPVATGQFGADMKVSITNDGPITIWLESRKKYD